jgi:hypothetical protein
MTDDKSAPDPKGVPPVSKYVFLGVLAVVIGAVILAVLISPLFFLIYFLWALFIPFIPTLINVGLSGFLTWLILKRLPPRWQRRKTVIGMGLLLLLTFLLAYNIRIPIIFYDIYASSDNKKTISRQLELMSGSRVVLDSNVDSVRFKESYIEFHDLALHELGEIVPSSISAPSTREDFFTWWLKGVKGLVIEKPGYPGAQARIQIQSNRNDYYDDVVVNIYDRDEKIAEYRHHFRVKFPGNKYLVFTQNKIWDAVLGLFLPSFISPVPPKPISQFFSEVFVVKEPPVQVKTRQLEVISIQKNLKNEVLSRWPDVRKTTPGCENRISFDSRYENEYLDYDGRPPGPKIGDCLIIKDSTGSPLPRVFIQTAEVSRYDHTRTGHAFCDEEGVTLLTAFAGVGTRKWLGSKEYIEDLTTFWLLKYSWTGELLNVGVFKIDPSDILLHDKKPFAHDSEWWMMDFKKTEPGHYSTTLWYAVPCYRDQPGSQGMRLIMEYIITFKSP